MPDDKSNSGGSRRVKRDTSKKNIRKSKSPLTYLYEVKEELDSINNSMEQVINDNRKVRLNLPGCYVKVYRKPEKLKTAFEGIAIIDPDMVLYVDEDKFEKAAYAVQVVNKKKKKMDLSTWERIFKSAQTIKQTLITELDKGDIEYIFV